MASMEQEIAHLESELEETNDLFSAMCDQRNQIRSDRDALAARLRETEARCERLRRVAVVVDRNINGESILDLIPENRELRDELAAALRHLVAGDLAPPETGGVGEEE